mmetsp:Transcript_9786/g.15688  ORF Transcript_9786/g.15688 Transcript_9786/m.15688 type:complete len:91 (+) Transcript_9786:171-443(+)
MINDLWLTSSDDNNNDRGVQKGSGWSISRRNHFIKKKQKKRFVLPRIYKDDGDDPTIAQGRRRRIRDGLTIMIPDCFSVSEKREQRVVYE